jgi:hypothetical protein
MTPFEQNSLNNFIAGWYMDTKVCDDIIEYFNSEECIRKPGAVQDLVNKDSTIREDVKKSTDAHLDNNQYLLNVYQEQLQQCLNQYIALYPRCDNVGAYRVLEPTNIQHYEPEGGFFTYHCERSGYEPYVYRHLAFMTYLNDVDDAGETEWLFQQIKVKPQKGLTLFWPAEWTHTHRGIASPTQEKYIITGWLNFV